MSLSLNTSYAYANEQMHQALQRCCDVGANEFLRLLKERACLYCEIHQMNFLDEHAAILHQARLERVAILFKERVEKPMQQLEQRALEEEKAEGEWESQWASTLSSIENRVNHHESLMGQGIASKKWQVADLTTKFAEVDTRISNETKYLLGRLSEQQKLADERLGIASRDTAANEANYTRLLPLQQQFEQLTARIRRI